MSKLEEKIEKFLEEFGEQIPQEVMEVMNQTTQKLINTKIGKNAKKKGDTIQNVSLVDINGKNVNLYDFIKNNDYLVISFYRGGWCPFCNLELNSLKEIVNDLEALKSSLIAISPQTPDNSLSTQEKNELNFTVLSDIRGKVAKDLGLIFALDEELRPLYESFGINIPDSNGDNSYEIPMPATYIIDKNGKIIFDFINEDYTKRVEPSAILEAIKSN